MKHQIVIYPKDKTNTVHVFTSKEPFNIRIQNGNFYIDCEKIKGFCKIEETERIEADTFSIYPADKKKGKKNEKD